MKSIIFLNTEFTKIKTGKEFDPGSITPTTTSKKVIFDKVTISSDVTNLYQKQISDKFGETLIKLDKNLEESNKKYDLLNQLIILEKVDKKVFDGNLEITKKNIQSIKTDFSLIEGKKNSDLVAKLRLNEILKIQNFSFETIYQKNIKNNDTNKLSEDTPNILRYGLNSEALEDLAESYIEKGVLHPYETDLFEKAINYLSSTKSAENHGKNTDPNKPYPNNTVLVDIFDRSSGIINKGNNQTHTIVLWRKKDTEIIIIDPSSVKFSEHIKDNVQDIGIKIINNLTIGGINIQGGIIYSPKNQQIIKDVQTGYSNYEEKLAKPRDCVDIAVKIAFEINEQQFIGTNIAQVESNAFSQISNNQNLNKNLGHNLNTTFIRELQSTDKDTRINAFNYFQNQHNIETINNAVKNNNITYKDISFNTLKVLMEYLGDFNKQK